MFTVNEKEYEFRFSTPRIKMVENAIKGSLMGEWYTANGMFSLQTLEFIFQFCVKEAGTDTFLGQKAGTDICQKCMSEHGYGTTALYVQEGMQNDMPFLFQAN